MGRDFRFWLLADILRGASESPLYPRKQTFRRARTGRTQKADIQCPQPGGKVTPPREGRPLADGRDHGARNDRAEVTPEVLKDYSARREIAEKWAVLPGEEKADVFVTNECSSRLSKL